MTDYTQIIPADSGRELHPDNWTPWIGKSDDSREIVRGLAAHKYIRESGVGRITSGSHTFTVYHWREGDPVHPNGRPKACHSTTYVVHPK